MNGNARHGRTFKHYPSQLQTLLWRTDVGIDMKRLYFYRRIFIPGLKESIKADLCNRIEYDFFYY